MGGTKRRLRVMVSFLWWGDTVPWDNPPRDNVPRDNVPKTIHPGDNMPRDNLPWRHHALETIRPGLKIHYWFSNSPRRQPAPGDRRQHAPETIRPGYNMPRDNVPRRHHAPETIRPGLKIHYWFSTLWGWVKGRQVSACWVWALGPENRHLVGDHPWDGRQWHPPRVCSLGLLGLDPPQKRKILANLSYNLDIFNGYNPNHICL